MKKLTALTILAVVATAFSLRADDLAPYATVRIKSFNTIPETVAVAGSFVEHPMVGMISMVANMKLKELQNEIKSEAGIVFKSGAPIAAAFSIVNKPDFDAIFHEDEDCEYDMDDFFEENLVFAIAIPVTAKNAGLFFEHQDVESDEWANSFVDVMDDEFVATFKKGHLVLVKYEGEDDITDALGKFTDTLVETAAAPFANGSYELKFHEPACAALADCAEKIPSNFERLDTLGMYSDIPFGKFVPIMAKMDKASNEIAFKVFKQVESIVLGVDFASDTGVSFDIAVALKSGEILNAYSGIKTLDADNLKFIADDAKLFFMSNDCNVDPTDKERLDILPALVSEFADLIPDAEIKADVKDFFKNAIAFCSTLKSVGFYVAADSAKRPVCAVRFDTTDTAAFKKYFTETAAVADKYYARFVNRPAPFKFDSEKFIVAFDWKTAFDEAIKVGGGKTEDLKEVASVFTSVFGEKTIERVMFRDNVIVEAVFPEGSDYKFGKPATADNAMLKAVKAQLPKDAKPFHASGISLSDIFAGVYETVAEKIPSFPEHLPKTLKYAEANPSPTVDVMWMDKNSARYRFNLPAAEIKNIVAFVTAMVQGDNEDDDDDWDFDDEEDDGDDE